MKMMAALSTVLKWIVPILVALYGAWYSQIIATRRYCSSNVLLNGTTAIITGANSGIGRETALDLARRGARVILACRNLQKAEDVAKDIKSSTGNSEVVVRPLDLSSLQSVREFAQQIIETEDRLDLLINNAGVAFVEEGTVTKENYHMCFGTNHFGHFLLTNLLLDLLKKSAPSRVITVSSNGHQAVLSPLSFTREAADGESQILYPYLDGYFESKLANILFSRELARRLKSTSVTSVSLHPGVVYTPIWATMPNVNWIWTLYYYLSLPFFRLLFIDETAGAQTTLHCALDESVAELSGKYFDNCAEYEPSTFAQDDELAKELWAVSCKATGLKCG